MQFLERARTTVDGGKRQAWDAVNAMSLRKYRVGPEFAQCQPGPNRAVYNDEALDEEFQN